MGSARVGSNPTAVAFVFGWMAERSKAVHLSCIIIMMCGFESHFRDFFIFCFVGINLNIYSEYIFCNKNSRHSIVVIAPAL